MNWVNVPLSSLCEKITDGSHNPAKGISHSKFIMLSSKNIFHNEINFDNPRYLTESDFNRENKRTDVSKNDILLTIVGTIGRVAVMPEIFTKFTLQRSVAVLKPKTEIVLPKFLMYSLRSITSYLESQARGVAQKGIYLKEIRDIKIPLPPLAEQKKIAAILDAADSLRQKDQQLIDHYTTLSQSLFLDMFGDPKSNPNNWDVTMLSEVIKSGPQNGLYKPSKVYGSGTPIVRIDSFHNALVNTDLLKRVKINKEEVERYQIFEGDFVINRVNSPSHLGKCGLMPELSEKMVFESNMMRIEFNSNLVNNSFMLFMLSSNYVKNQILSSSKDAVNQSSINQKDVNSFIIPLPPIDKQNQFSIRMISIEAQKQQAQASLKKSNDLFNSLLQRAFKAELSGSSRFNDNLSTTVGKGELTS